MRALQASMTAHEFAEWLAYSAVEPFGPRADEWRAGVLASAVVAPHIKSGAKKPEPPDFFPTLRPDGPVKRQTPAQMMLLCKMLAKAGRGTFTPAGKAE